MTRARLALAAGSIAWLAAPAQTFADPNVTCLAEARGVPHTGNSPPDWLTWVGPPEDDPGWTGATQTSHGLAAEHANVRAIHDAGENAVYLSFESRIGLSASTKGELYFGFDDGANTKVVWIRINHTAPSYTGEAIPCLTGTTPLPAHCTSDPDFSYQVFTATSGAVPIASDAETEAAQWVNDTGRVWTRPDGFLVFVKVPLASLGITLSAASPASFWYQYNTRLTADNTYVFSLAKWPFGTGDVNQAGAFLTSPPVAGAVGSDPWGTLRIGTTDASCREGVRIDRTGLGIAHGAASEPLTNQIVGVEAGSPVSNFFVARPEMSGGGALPVDLEARFRIADWGSAVEWVSVHTKTGGTEWVPLVGTQFASQPWALSVAERCAYGIPAAGDLCGPPALNRHQCVLTELRATAGGVVIETDSVYRNTNFVNLSRFSRRATIGATGLSPRTGEATIDYYLYVDRRRMPRAYRAPTNPRREVELRIEALIAEIERDYSPPAKVVEELRRRAERDPKAAAELKRLIEAARAAMPPKTRTRYARLRETLKSGKVYDQVPGLGTELIEEIMPSMIVYVTRDSGRDVEVAGEKLRVLDAQSAFGYYPRHDGAIGGWDAVLAGADRLGSSNWYHLQIGPDGSKRVDTRIATRKAGGKGCCHTQVAPGDGAGSGLLALLTLIACLLILRRRRQPS